MVNIIDEDLLRKFLAWLDAAYYNEESGEWGRGSHEDYLSSKFDFGNSYTLAATLILPLRESGHKVQMAGNESQVMAPYRPDSIGLDWLFVDNRYIIDMWGHVYEGLRIVYDLQNPEDKAAADKNFPPINEWEFATASEAGDAQIENGANVFHNFMLPQTAVDDLLGGMTER